VSKEEMLKHTTGRTRAVLDTLKAQTGVDPWEYALENFHKMRQLDPQQQAWTVESWLDIMAENKMALTWDSALNAAKFLESSQLVDIAAGEQPKPAPFKAKSEDVEADFFNNPNVSAEEIGRYLQQKHGHR